MKHLKRSLALLLSMALILAVMAGCGGSASSAPAAEASKSEPAPAATEEAAPEQPQAPASDEVASTAETSAAEEETIPDLQLPLTEGETLSYWQTKPGGAVANMAPNGYFDYPHFQEAARLTGVTLDFIQADFMVANAERVAVCASSSSFWLS